jgi:hypothetical protein
VDLEDGTVTDARKRWDTDDQFTGVADASQFAPAVEELAELARRPRWVAEDPELHLAPHLRRASVDGLRIGEIQTAQDGTLTITAEATKAPAAANSGDLRGRSSVLSPSPQPACGSDTTTTQQFSRLSQLSLTTPGRSPATATPSGSLSRQPPRSRGTE